MNSKEHHDNDDDVYQSDPSDQLNESHSIEGSGELEEVEVNDLPVANQFTPMNADETNTTSEHVIEEQDEPSQELEHTDHEPEELIQSSSGHQEAPLIDHSTDAVHSLFNHADDIHSDLPQDDADHRSDQLCETSQNQQEDLQVDQSNYIQLPVDNVNTDHNDEPAQQSIDDQTPFASASSTQTQNPSHDTNTLNQPTDDYQPSDTQPQTQSPDQTHESHTVFPVQSPDVGSVTLSDAFESSISDESDTTESYHGSPVDQLPYDQSGSDGEGHNDGANGTTDERTVESSFKQSSATDQNVTQQSFDQTSNQSSDQTDVQPITQSTKNSIEQHIDQPIVEPEDYKMLHQWLACIAVVKFDLENGPSLEYKFPPDDAEADCQSINQAICALAFPDSHCHILGDLSFCFRMRIDDTINQSISQSSDESNDLTQLASKSDRSSVRFQSNSQSLFGFVCFRQTKDSSNPRGFFQKSTVILTVLPCVSLFERMTRMIGNAYHLYGPSIVESAARSISKWPRPQPGRTVRLPLLGTLIDEHLPQYNSLSPTHRPSATPASVGNNQSNKVFDFSDAGRPHSLPVNQPPIPAQSPISLSSLFSSLHSSQGWFQSVNLFSTFESHVHNLWYLWELVLTGEPVMVKARTPACASTAVLGLISLIAPVIFVGDFRPYFTVYDRDFKHYLALHNASTDQTVSQSMRGLIVGVTNPYFFKCWANLPHVLTLTEPVSESSITAIQEYDTDQANHRDEKPKKSAKSPTSTLSPRTMHKLHRTMDTDDDSSIKQSILMSKLTPTLLPDESILKKLVFASPKDKTKNASNERKVSDSKGSEKKKLNVAVTPYIEINNALLRKYFHDLTSTFLSAFNPYVTFDPVVQRKYSQDNEWNPYMKWPELKKLDQKEFLKNVDIHSINQSNFSGAAITFPINANALTRRSKISSLYTRFVNGPHFAAWFDDARAAAQAHVNSMIFTRIKKISSEAEAGFPRFKAQARYDNRNAIDMTARCWSYIELAIADEHCIDISLVSVLFLHLSLIRRATPPSQMSELEKIEKDKQHIIQRFANKAQTHSKVAKS